MSLAIPAVSVHAHHFGLVVGIELVGEIADERAEEVFHGEDSFYPTMLVDNDGKGPSLLSHLGQHVEDEA